MGKLTLPEDEIMTTVGAPMLTTGVVRSAVPVRVAVVELPATSVTVALTPKDPSV
jgi:hypothetical protein